MMTAQESTIPFARRRRLYPENYYTDQAILSAGPRSVLKSMLMPDENVLQIGIISNGIYWRSIAVAILGLVIMVSAIFAGIFLKPIAFIALFILVYALFMFIWAYLTQHYLLLAATNKRVIIRFGVMNIEVAQMHYSKIESSEVFMSFMGSYLGYASVIISGTGGHTMVVPYIINASRFRNIINEAMLNKEEHVENRDEIIQAVPVVPDTMFGSTPSLI